jgi:hypothetical protein
MGGLVIYLYLYIPSPADPFTEFFVFSISDSRLEQGKKIEQNEGERNVPVESWARLALVGRHRAPRPK